MQARKDERARLEGLSRPSRRQDPLAARPSRRQDPLDGKKTKKRGQGQQQGEARNEVRERQSCGVHSKSKRKAQKNASCEKRHEGNPRKSKTEKRRETLHRKKGKAPTTKRNPRKSKKRKCKQKAKLRVSRQPREHAKLRSNHPSTPSPDPASFATSTGNTRHPSTPSPDPATAKNEGTRKPREKASTRREGVKTRKRQARKRENGKARKRESGAFSLRRGQDTRKSENTRYVKERRAQEGEATRQGKKKRHDKSRQKARLSRLSETGQG
jgi:hypothetical protein